MKKGMKVYEDVKIKIRKIMRCKKQQLNKNLYTTYRRKVKFNAWYIFALNGLVVTKLSRKVTRILQKKFSNSGKRCFDRKQSRIADKKVGSIKKVY